MKIRYINPLVRNDEKFDRVCNISESARTYIKKTLDYKTAKYTYLDFELLDNKKMREYGKPFI